MSGTEQAIREKLETELIHFFAESFDEKIEPGTRLIDDFIVDSMGIGELIAFASEKYGVDFSDEDLTVEHFQTVADIARLIADKLSHAA